MIPFNIPTKPQYYIKIIHLICQVVYGSSLKIVVISAISCHEHPDLFSTKGALV
jgi:hypothetical protein